VNLPLSQPSVADFVRFLLGVNSPGARAYSTINGLRRAPSHHARRRQRADNTLKTGDGFLRDRQPAPRRDREVRCRRPRRGPRAPARARCRSGSSPDRARTSIRAACTTNYRNDSLQHEHLVQRPGRHRQGEPAPEPVGRPRGGPLSIPGLFDRRDRRGSSSSTTRVPPAVKTSRQPHGPVPVCRNGRLPLQHHGRHWRGEPCSRWRRERPSRDDRARRRRNCWRTSAPPRHDRDDHGPGDPLFQRYSFNVAQKAKRQYPTMRIDANVSARHRASFVVNYQNFADTPTHSTTAIRSSRFPSRRHRVRSGCRSAPRCARRWEQPCQ